MWTQIFPRIQGPLDTRKTLKCIASTSYSAKTTLLLDPPLPEKLIHFLAQLVSKCTSGNLLEPSVYPFLLSSRENTSVPHSSAFLSNLVFYLEKQHTPTWPLPLKKIPRFQSMPRRSRQCETTSVSRTQAHKQTMAVALELDKPGYI